MEQVTREIFVDAEPQDVWDAITSDELLGEWFGSEVDGAIEPGEVVHAGGRRAVIERVEAPHRLTFRWLGDESSRVDIAIDETQDGSVVRVVERRVEEAVSSEMRYGFRALART